MANIDPYVEAIRSAVYGEEVRGSIANAIVAMNFESSEAKTAAIQGQNSAVESAAVAAANADRAEEIVAELGPVFLVKGTVTFANLPVSPEPAWLYTVSDAFITTSNFIEGAGYPISPGATVYYTTANKWCVLSGAVIFRSLVVTLLPQNWVLANSSTYTQTVTASGVTLTDFVIATLGEMTTEDRNKARGGNITCVSQAVNSLTFESEALFDISVPINVLLIGGVRVTS